MIAAIHRVGDESLRQWTVRNWKFITVAVLATGIASAAVYSLVRSGSSKPSSPTSDANVTAAAKRKRKSDHGKKPLKTAKAAAAAAAATTPPPAAVSSVYNLTSASVASLDSLVTIDDSGVVASEAATKHDMPKAAPAHISEQITAANGANTDHDSTDRLYPTDVEALSTEVRSQLAQEAKVLGNKLYSQKEFARAIEIYTQAILLAPTAIFYCNRAAAFANLSKFDDVVNDCTRALEMDKKYLKALNRRATAYESLGRLTDALNDFTVVCVLQKFSEASSMTAPDRILKKISADMTAEFSKTKIPQMPSKTFIRAYMDSFRAEPSQVSIVENCQDTSESIQILKQAAEAIKERSWTEAFEHCVRAIDVNDFQNEKIEAIAHNLRGTFSFLMGRIELSVSDLDRALELDPTSVNSVIKRGTLFMERGEVEKTVEMFETAEKLDPTNVDLFYHRGQVRFLTADYQGAVDDYAASIKNEKEGESSVYVHIQMAVAKYKLNDHVGAEKKFKEVKRLFPNSAEVFNYYGEIHMDRQAFSEALKSFDRSIEMDPNSPLPYINKAILYLHWKQDLNTAESECRKALAVDPLCDIAYSQLAQLLCHQHKMDEAIKVYDEAICVTRTDTEVMNMMTCREAARAQKYVAEMYPEAIPNMNQS
ncbi:hypothetical protein BASA62_007653 [Batrachochytrium salamandrivorans]|nr:hypothetical protein BASA62_007653 [Batrachochytrium salamandrivorans]